MSEEMTFFVAAIDATAATNGGRGGHQGGEDGEQQRAAQVTAQVQRLRSAAMRVSILADLSHSAVTLFRGNYDTHTHQPSIIR